MSKKAKKSKVVTSKDFLKMVVEELSLKPDDYFMIGHGAHLCAGHPQERCEATKETLVSYMVVDTATFLYLTEGKGLKAMKVSGYDMATLPGEGPNGQGGVTFVAAANGLSFLYNSSKTIYDFLMGLIDFRGYMEGAVSLNVLAYLATATHLKEKFFADLSYDFVKERLFRQSNVGRTLFCEPSTIFEGILVVNKAREIKNWDPERNIVEKLFDDAVVRQETDEDVLEYHRLAALPQFIDPRGKETVEFEPLFQETVIPDPKIVTPFDPNL